MKYIRAEYLENEGRANGNGPAERNVGCLARLVLVHRERGVDACGHTYSSITTHIQQYATLDM